MREEIKKSIGKLSDFRHPYIITSFIKKYCKFI